MKNLIIKCIAYGSMAFAATGALGQEPDAKILRLTNPSQSIGVHIGDVLERRIEVEVDAPYQISKNTFPMKGSNQNGIELVDIKVNAAQHEHNTLYTIALRYQVFAHAQIPGAMALPTEEFAITGGPRALSIKVPVWRFWFSPLVAGSIGSAKDSLQPQYKPTLVESDDHRLRLVVLLGLFITGLAGLVYINADHRWLPFMNGAMAQAYLKIKKLPKTKGQEKLALLYLHQALNDIHGANLFSRDIDLFLAQHPEFRRMKAGMESFFERSNQSLFANQHHDGEKFIDDLLSFSKRLRDCERGAS